MIRQAGYSPAKSPTIRAKTPVNINRGILPAKAISEFNMFASQVFAIPLKINSEITKESRQIGSYVMRKGRKRGTTDISIGKTKSEKQRRKEVERRNTEKA